MRSILFIGQLYPEGRSMQRCLTLQRMGCAVTPLSSYSFIHKASVRERIFWKLGFPLDTSRINGRIGETVSTCEYDIIWVEKENCLKPQTLASVRRLAPRSALVSCSEDDMYARHNHSVYYRLGLHYYDVVFTTKTYNLTELKNFGAKRVELFLDAYDDILHRPLELSEKDCALYGCDVGFIGTYEKDRAEKMLFLARQGIAVTVWGDGWAHLKNANQNLSIKGKALYQDEYVKALNATNINLCFLRKMNRDQTTSRSVEIPASGGFMLAERTLRHQELFEEGKEAAFFDVNSPQDLLEKVRYYLAHEEERLSIARGGRARCMASAYSHRAQLENILKLVG